MSSDSPALAYSINLPGWLAQLSLGVPNNIRVREPTPAEDPGPYLTDLLGAALSQVYFATTLYKTGSTASYV